MFLRNRLSVIIICFFMLSFHAFGLSQHWLEKLENYEPIVVENITFNFHRDKSEIYREIAVDLDKRMYLNAMDDRTLKQSYDNQTLVDLAMEQIERIMSKLPLSIPDTSIYLYPDADELFRVTSYSDSFYVVGGNEVHLKADEMYKITEYILAYNFPNMERKLLEALARYFTPEYNGVHQKAQYWLNFQELPPLRTFSVKSFVAMTEKDWDAFISFLGFVLEEKVKPGFLWNNVKDLDSIAALLKTTLTDLESEWFRYIQNTFYLKMARQEEVKAGQSAAGIVLLENNNEPILDAKLKVYSSVPGRPQFEIVTEENYYQILTGESFIIRFQASTPKTREQLEESAWLNRAWNMFVQTIEEGMNLQKPADELIESEMEAYPKEMLLSAVFTYRDGAGKTRQALMSYPVKIVE